LVGERPLIQSISAAERESTGAAEMS